MMTPRNFCEVGRHRTELAQHPHGQGNRLGRVLACQFGKILPSGDAKLGGKRLKQHRDEVGQHDDPEQAISEARAALNVRREISGVHVSDGRYECGAGEGQQRAKTAAIPRQRVVRGRNDSRTARADAVARLQCAPAKRDRGAA